MSNHPIENEEHILSSTKELLAKHGSVTTQFITSSLDPMPFSRRADLVFVPHNEPSRVYIVELKTHVQDPADAVVVSGVRHIRAIRQSNPSLNVYFAIALSDMPGSETAKLADANGIKLLGPVGTGKDLLDAIISWANSEILEATLRVLASGMDEIRASSRDIAVNISSQDYLRLLAMENEIELEATVKIAPPSGLLADRFEQFEVQGEVYNHPKILGSTKKVEIGDQLRIQVRRE